MGMELGVEVAGGVVAEGGGDHALFAGADHAAGIGVLPPGLDDIAFEPDEGAADRGVVRRDDARVPADQRGERDGLGGREGDVAAGTVMQASVPIHASEPAAGAVRHLAGQHVAEGLGIDGALEAEHPGALAGPGAGFAVGGVVLRVVAVAFVVGDALRGGGDGPDRGDHVRWG